MMAPPQTARSTVVTFLTLSLLVGCASDTGVVGMGDGIYLMERQQATGLPGVGSMKGEMLGEAGAFCTQEGGSLSVIGTEESQPPYVLGNYPRVSLTFGC